MSDEYTYESRAVSELDVDPLTAFTKLRTYTPGRAAFLLESHAPDTPEGRYSIVGYRVKRCELSPPGHSPLDELGKAEQKTEPEDFAQAIAQGVVTFLSYSAFAHKHNIQWCPDDGPSGLYLSSQNILLFDHREGTITAAGRIKGKGVERLLWELEHAPEVAPLGDVDVSATPDALSSVMSEEQLAAKATRGKRFLGEEIDELWLAHIFTSPRGKADPFDVYRALRAQKLGSHTYYADSGESPVAPRLEISGVTDHALFVRRRGDDSSIVEGMKDAIPHAQTTGPDGAWAGRLARRLEDSSRQFYGGAVGYSCPGGEAVFMLTERNVLCHSGMFEHAVPVPVKADSETDQLASGARERAQPALGAIHAAQRLEGRDTPTSDDDDEAG